MSTQYGKPPITEAILDIRVDPRPGVSAIEIADGFRDIADRYPNRQELPPNPTLQFSFGLGATPQPSQVAVLGGFRYESGDKQCILQARRDAFAFSLRPPYESWETFSAIVRPLWNQYRTVWRPRLITRVALRYVNGFTFPIEEVQSLNEHVGLLPEFPHGELLANRELAQSLVRMVLPQGDIGATAIVQQASQHDATMKMFLVNLDIDLHIENLVHDPNDDEALWSMIGQLRVRKNELFRASITDKTELRLEPV